MIELKRLDCKKIRLVAEEQPYKAAEGSKLVGKKFNTYQYNGIRFIVNCDEEFCSLHKAGSLGAVDLAEGTRETTDKEGNTITVNTLAVENWLTHSDFVNDKKFGLMLEALTVENFKPEAVDFAALVG